MSAATDPGVYPGNPALPREVREKILSTFRHTLNLFKEGKLDDCLIGCDFILKMDPRFSPARRLLEKSRNPAAAVDLAELETLVAATPTRQERVGAAEPDRLLVRAVESFNARDFDAAIATAEQVLVVLPGNQNAQEILDNARRKKSVQPEFEAARHRAIAALDRSRPSEARPELARMRVLDPDHPAVPLLESRIGSVPAPQAAPEEAGLGGMMDFSLSASDLDGSLDRATEEPEIVFGRTDRPAKAAAPAAADGLDALSLDSLSLDGDGGSAVTPPPPDPLSHHRSPLGDAEDATAAPRAAPPESKGPPKDFWREEPPPDEEQTQAPPRRAVPSPASSASLADADEGEDSGPAEREIDSLLQQGEDAAERGDRQGAIEIWSRIFLIDINNVEAVTRIERTRQQMSEGNRRVAECLKSGRQLFESGDFGGAREAFLEVLATDESDATARSYLDRIEGRLADPGLEEEPAVARSLDAGPAASEAPARKVSIAKRPRRFPVPPRIALMVGAFLLLVGVAAWFLLRHPAPAAPPKAAGAAAAGGSLQKATSLFQEGKIPETISELKRIRPSDPDYAKARQLLASLDRPAAAGAPAVAVAAPDAPPPAPPAESNPQRLRAEAETALSEKRYIDSLRAFRGAAPAFLADPAFSKAMAVASDRVSELTPAVKLYNEGEYETAIPVLWRLVQADRSNQDARSYLLRCYYNQGVTQLQNGLFAKAKQSFDEALELAPQDAQLLRNRKFAERYLKEDLDLMGRIYVRHLSHRP